jgi:ferredoxin
LNTPFLRKARIIVSFLFFITTTFLLIDIYGFIPQSVSNKILYLQFVPSVIKFITLTSLTVSGFVIILLLTILFGRVYCSSICPLGVLQDIINFISKKVKKKKKRFGFMKEQKILRLSLLAIPVIIFLFGSSIAVNLLDPYSIYGRFAGFFFRPGLIYINNIVAFVFERMKLYSVSNFEIRAFTIIPFLIVFAFFIFVAVLAYKKGRLYCNTVCPVGTLLGYLSKFSLFQIVIKKEDCLSCGACARDCKSGCIDSKEKTVDMSRCVACFDCLSSCPTDGLLYDFKYRKEKTANKSADDSVDENKRQFVNATALYLLSFSSLTAQAVKNVILTKKSTRQIFKKSAISPPGSIGVNRFNSKCTACHLCVSSCPTQVLQPSFLEYGFLGMLQPRMDYNANYCNFDCKICSEVCPTGAISPINIEKKKLTQIGTAKFLKDNCVVNTQKTDCGACSEHCPTKAVHMIPFENNLVIPEVREDYCIGCGACEHACPVVPYKAIYVEGNRIHKTAKKNVEEKTQKEQKINYKEEFPF